MNLPTQGWMISEKQSWFLVVLRGDPQTLPSPHVYGTGGLCRSFQMTLLALRGRVQETLLHFVGICTTVLAAGRGQGQEQAVENRERTEARVEAGTAIARLQTLCKGAISNLLWTQSQCSALLRELEEAPGP